MRLYSFVPLAFLFVVVTDRALAQSQGRDPNILVVVMDDVGVDMVGAYLEGTNEERTPVLDELARTGIRFTNAYANPVCSPTRASILTGRYGFRTGIGNVMESGGEDLPADEITIPEVLDRGARKYSHAAIGKWHLCADPHAEDSACEGTPVPGSTAPNDAGFSHYAGSIANVADYYDWCKTVDGWVSHTSKYITSDNVDSALEWIEGEPNPWFCYLAFNAAHVGLHEGRLYHVPPAELHTFDDQIDRAGPLLGMQLKYMAILEAMDTELGRLLESLPPGVRRNTIVIVIGDNGTPGQVTQPPYPKTHGKATVYEGGIRVPLIVSGRAVRRPGVCGALVNATDLFATVAELAGADLDRVIPSRVEIDSVSLVPYFTEPDRASIRPWAFSEIFTPNHDPDHQDPTRSRRAIRNARFKLVRKEADAPKAPGVRLTVEELYDLERDPHERNDLLRGALTREARENYRTLKAELDTLLADRSRR